MILKVTKKNYKSDVKKIKSLMKVTHLMHNEGTWGEVEPDTKHAFSILKNRPWHFKNTIIVSEEYGTPFIERHGYPKPYSLVYSYDEKDKKNGGTLFMVELLKKTKNKNRKRGTK